METMTPKIMLTPKMYKASYSLMFMKYIHNIYLLTTDMTKILKLLLQIQLGMVCFHAT